MKTQAKTLLICSIVGISGVVFAQAGYMGDSMAAINMNNTVMGASTGAPGAPMPAPGMVGGVGNPGVGYNPATMGGNTMPGAMGDPTLMGGDPLMMGANPGGAVAVITPAATPIPTENVLIGRRVFDAVSGGLLEDAIEIAVRKSDVDAYPDDGLRDNGIAGDGIRGNVDTVTGQYIGAFSNMVKNHLVHAVDKAEQIDPMIYYGYHVAKTEPRSEGLKRYGLALPGQQEVELLATPVPDLPNVLTLEDSRDELVRQWGQDFLAEYRIVPEDPQSEFLPVFVPAPPLTPPNYPIPNGYVSNQAVAKARDKELDAKSSEQAQQQAQSRQSSRGGGGGGGGEVGMPGGGI